MSIHGTNAPRKFRKRPVVIEAIFYEDTYDGETAVLRFCASRATYYTSHKSMVIDTLEGRFTASPGDWIIKGVKGEFYPCKPDIFEQTYEPVEEDGTSVLLPPAC